MGLIILGALLTAYNLIQARDIGQTAASEFAEQIEQARQDELSNYLSLAISSIQHLREHPDANTDPAIQEEAKDILRNLRFDDAGDVGYMFVYDEQGVSIAHGVNSSLEGENLIDFQDPNGVYLIQELLDAAMAGGDFVEYGWSNPDGTPGPKLGYAEMLDDWGWMVGTGFWI